MDLLSLLDHDQLLSQIFADAGEEFHLDNHGEHTIINGYIALPVHEIESSINTDQDIHIKDLAGNLLGILCATTPKPYIINELSIPKLTAFVTDISEEQLGTGNTYTFRSHYLLVKSEFIDQYIAHYLESSALWGGFTHETKKTRYKKQHHDITLPIQIFIPTTRHKEDLAKSVSAPSGFDRFLKFYHQLELLFDVIFVFKIRSLPKENIEGFGTVVKEYQRKELDILKNMMKDYVPNSASILNIMKNCPPYITVMDSVFQDNTKEGNPNAPDKNPEKWAKFLSFLQGSEHSPAKAKEHNLISNPRDDLLTQYIINTAAYWIYRIRCSIAHNKIGEFIFNDSHEEFVVEIGERLIKDVIQQIFSDSQLKTILEN